MSALPWVVSAIRKVRLSMAVHILLYQRGWACLVALRINVEVAHLDAAGGEGVVADLRHS